MGRVLEGNDSAGMPGEVSIGEFARLTHLSVKSLHHYHEVGVLVPARIEVVSGYRRYSLSQVPEAHMIRRLRALEMPLAGVRSVLRARDIETRDELLRDHLAHMQSELARVESMVASLRALLGGAPTLRVERRHIPAQTALVSSDLVTSRQIGDWITHTLEDLHSAATRVDLPVIGPTGATYSREYFETGRGEVTAYLPVRAPDPTESGLGVRELTGGTFAVAIHVGAYENLDQTYGALGSHVIEHRLDDPSSDEPIRETYLLGPGEAETDAFRTEVCWPIRTASAGTTETEATRSRDPERQAVGPFALTTVEPQGERLSARVLLDEHVRVDDALVADPLWDNVAEPRPAAALLGSWFAQRNRRDLRMLRPVQVSPPDQGSPHT